MQRKHKGLLPNYILNHHKTGWRFSTDEILIGRREQHADEYFKRLYNRDIERQRITRFIGIMI